MRPIQKVPFSTKLRWALTAPLWIWNRGARRDAITLAMWAVPMWLRGRRYRALGEWFMRRWHPKLKESP